MMRSITSKFLRRIRIRGGEFDASARAMHREAAIGNVPSATNERKSMSTKTTFKRVALVAVASLGIGGLSIIASPVANAAAATPTAISVGTIPTAQVGVANVTPVTVTFPTGTGSDTFTVNVRVTSAPTGSSYKTICANLATGCTASGTTVLAKVILTLPTSGDVGLIGTVTASNDSVTVGARYTSSTVRSAAGTATLNLSVMPDIAGAYTVLVSTHSASTGGAEANNVSAYAAPDANLTYSFTTAAQATVVTLSSVTGSTTAGSTSGQLIKVALKDASGAISQLAANETVALTTDRTTATIAVVTQSTGATGTFATTQSLTNANFTSGYAYVKITDSAAEAIVLTATGSGLLASTVTSALSVSTKTLVTPTLVTLSNPASATRPGEGHVGFASAADTASIAATSHSYLATITAGTAGDYLKVSVTDTSGKITGIAGLVYDYALATSTTTTATVTITGTLSTAGQSFVAVVAGTTSGTVTVTSAAAAATTMTVSPAATIKAAIGGSSALSAVLTDQFGAAMVSTAVTATTTLRNATTAVALVTDANGRVTYTRTDAGTSATVLVQDLVTFASGSATAPVTINYGAYGVVTHTLATPTTSDTANAITYTDIDAASTAGASTGGVTITSTVKDVNGALLTGIPVTFTTSSAGAAVKSTSATVYTALGVAGASVYCWTSGVKTFTATAGTVVATGTINCREGGGTTATPGAPATKVRTIAATVSGHAITVIAKDRFGNTVNGVILYATRTGSGLFGGGSNTATATTDINGSAEFIFNAGATDSVVTVYASGSATTTNAFYGQTASTAGSIACAADCTQTAFTAATVGTIYVAETGIGDSLSPAGINSVSLTVPADTTATDAANAATDAANAATDAANYAADAADAATTAAEEATAAATAAQDSADAASAAVVALGLRVEALYAATRAQITSLSNLVVRLIKKAKA